MIEKIRYSLGSSKANLLRLSEALGIRPVILDGHVRCRMYVTVEAGSREHGIIENWMTEPGHDVGQHSSFEATPEELAMSDWFSNVGCRWIEDHEKQVERPRYNFGDCPECGSDRRRHLDPLRGTFGSLRKFHLVRKPQALFLFSTKLAALAEERGWTGVELRPVLDRKTDAPSDLFKEAWITSILPPMHPSAGIVRFKPCPYCETCKRIGYQMPGPQPVYARGALDGSADWNLSSEWLAPHFVPCPDLICSRSVVHELLNLEPTQKWIPVKFVDP